MRPGAHTIGRILAIRNTDSMSRHGVTTADALSPSGIVAIPEKRTTPPAKMEDFPANLL